MLLSVLIIHNSMVYLMLISLSSVGAYQNRIYFNDDWHEGVICVGPKLDPQGQALTKVEIWSGVQYIVIK